MFYKLCCERLEPEDVLYVLLLDTLALVAVNYRLFHHWRMQKQRHKRYHNCDTLSFTLQSSTYLKRQITLSLLKGV